MKESAAVLQGKACMGKHVFVACEPIYHLFAQIVLEHSENRKEIQLDMKLVNLPLVILGLCLNSWKGLIADIPDLMILEAEDLGDVLVVEVDSAVIIGLLSPEP